MHSKGGRPGRAALCGKRGDDSRGKLFHDEFSLFVYAGRSVCAPSNTSTPAGIVSCGAELGLILNHAT